MMRRRPSRALDIALVTLVSTALVSMGGGMAAADTTAPDTGPVEPTALAAPLLDAQDASDPATAAAETAATTAPTHQAEEATPATPTATTPSPDPVADEPAADVSEPRASPRLLDSTPAPAADGTDLLLAGLAALAGGPTLLADVSGALTCSPQQDGNNPSRPDRRYGKIEGSHWAEGSVPAVTWTFSADKKSITIVFGDDFDAATYPISDIIVAGGNAHSTCSVGYYFEAGDSVTVTTVGVLLNNGGNPPDISHVSLYLGSGGPQPDPEPAQIVVTKKIAVDGNLADATPAAGWTFGAATASDGATLSATSGTTDPDGTTEFSVDFDDADGSALVTITEQQQDGFTLLPQDSANAVCTVGDEAESLTVTDDGTLGFTAEVHPGDQVACTVINQQVLAEAEPAQIEVTKLVVPADGTLDDATPAGGWTFEAATTSVGATVSDLLGTTTDPDGTTAFTVAFDGESEGSAQVAVTEQQQDGFTLLPQDSANAVCTVGDEAEPLTVSDIGTVGFTAEVHPGDQVACTLVNQAVTDRPAHIEVTKLVVPADGNLDDATPAGGWTFEATTSDDATLSSVTGTTADPDGTTEFSVDFDEPDGSAPVTITELQQDGFTLLPQDSANAVCTVGDEAESLTVTDDGTLGFTAEVHPGDQVACTVINQEDEVTFLDPPPAAQITITKEVLYVGADEAVPGEGWTFDARTASLAAVMAQAPGSSVTTGVDGTAHFEMEFDSAFAPAGTASLTVVERPQVGYALVKQGLDNAVCTTAGNEAPNVIDNVGVLGFSIEVGPGDDISCTVVNRELVVMPSPDPSDEVTSTPTATEVVFQSQVLSSSLSSSPPSLVYVVPGAALAATGADIWTVVVLVGGLLLLGTGLALVARRRQVG